MDILVGNTGFVGNNILKNHYFDYTYNSKNINESYGKNPDLLVYAGVPAEKFLANNFPEKDLHQIMNAFNNIKLINPKKVVLISSIDVYKNSFNKTEDEAMEEQDFGAYGKNRLYLEKLVREYYKENAYIIRLPALYGEGIKKNFIFDMMHRIPQMLSEKKFLELSVKSSLIKKSYFKLENGFYKINNLNYEDKNKLETELKKIGFTSLNFTDSRSIYQFYNLDNLWGDISKMIDKNINLLNITSFPIKASELYEYVYGEKFINEINDGYPNYNLKTKYCKLYSGNDGYIYDKMTIMKSIKQFILTYNAKLSISNIAWNKEDEQKVLELLKKNGYDAIEIAPTKLCEDPYDNIDYYKKYSKDLRNKYNLSISSMQSIWYGKTENIFNSKSEMLTLIDYTKKAIDFASQLCIKNIVFGCPKNRNILEKSNMENATIFFSEIGKYSQEHSTIFSIEPNPTIYNTNYINTTKEAIELVKSLNIDGLKVNLDFGTVIQNNESLDLIRKNIKYINHIHISEPFLEKVKVREEHKKLAKILCDENFIGYVSIEMKETNDIESIIKYVMGVFKNVKR